MLQLCGLVRVFVRKLLLVRREPDNFRLLRPLQSFFNSLNNRQGLYDQSRSTAVRRPIHSLPLIIDKIARIIESYLNLLVLYGALENRFSQIRIKGLWEKSYDVEMHH